MNVILYNPLSRSGNKEYIRNIVKKKLKLTEGEFILVNLVNVSNPEEFIREYEDAKSFIIFGGDGTLSVLVNNLIGLDIKPKIYFYASGTGNDFRRSIKSKKGLVEISNYIKDLPFVEFNDEKKLFLNGVGLGLDALVCYKVNNNHEKKSKMNYFKSAISAFRESNKSNIYINDVLYEDVWFVSVMNDKYFGGGMKIAPKASRLDKTLDIVVIKKAPKWLLTLIFPTIYLGIHVLFKRYVKILRVKQAYIKYDLAQYFQIDGEDFIGIKEIYVER